MASLPVALDAMGGDLGCDVVVEGALLAFRELGIPSLVIGRESEIHAALEKLGARSESGISVQHAGEVVTMEDTPSAAIRHKPDSSIRVAFEVVAQGKAAAVVSPGNTGAVMATGLFVSGTLPGITRPAIASLIPKVGDASPTVLLDSGANIDCNAQQLVQFALMGNYYAISAIACARPRVALLSNGTEPSKGTDVIRAAAITLNELKNIDFVGYVEGRDMARDLADVVVCDGFVGNVVLKAMEGSVELVVDSIRHYVEQNARGRMGMWLARPMLKKMFSERLDPSAYGGAPLLGLNDIAIICHGSANSRAIMNAVRVARKFYDEGLVAKISGALGALDIRMTGSDNDGFLKRVSQRFDKRERAVNDKERGREPVRNQKKDQ